MEFRSQVNETVFSTRQYSQPDSRECVVCYVLCKKRTEEYCVTFAKRNTGGINQNLVIMTRGRAARSVDRFRNMTSDSAPYMVLTSFVCFALGGWALGLFILMEVLGIEPRTSCVLSTRSAT